MLTDVEKQYIEKGIVIIPIPTGKKYPSIKWTDFKNKRPSMNTYAMIFANGDKNVAIITGKLSGLVVLDIDTKDMYEAIKHRLPETPTVKTSRGYHVYFQYQEGMRNFQKIAELPDIDFRAEGGLIIAPPSIHESGHVYSWVEGKSIFDIPLAEMPEFLKKYAFRKEKAPIINTDLKAINIMDVAQKLGIDIYQIDNKNQMKCFRGHDTKTASFTFYPESNSFYCFGCDIGGSVIDLVKDYKECSAILAMQWLRNEFVIENNKKEIKHIEDVHAETKTDIIDAIKKRLKGIDYKEKFVEFTGFSSDKLKQSEYIWLTSKCFFEFIGEGKMKYLNDVFYIYTGKFWKQFSRDEIMQLCKEMPLEFGLSANIAGSAPFVSRLFDQIKLDSLCIEDERRNQKISVNLKNKTIDFINGEVVPRDFSSDDFFTYALDFDYNCNATCPMFMQYLNRVLPEEDSQRVLQEFTGYIFTKNTALKLEKVLILFGEGHNGKSVFFDILNGLLGDQNVSNFSSRDLDQEHYRAILVDKLLNYSSEFGAGMERETLKQLASGEPIGARHKYGAPFIARDYARIAFNANTLPTDIEMNTAFFRRFLIVPFYQMITQKERDPQLARKIIDNELSGVFNWAIEGLKRIIQTRRFSDSKESMQALENYKYENDSVAKFLDETNINYKLEYEYEKISLKEMYIKYKSFCTEDGYKALGKKNFSKRLKFLGYEIKAGTGGVYFVNKEELF